jgi:hypothetical protein
VTVFLPPVVKVLVVDLTGIIFSDEDVITFDVYFPDIFLD